MRYKIRVYDGGSPDREGDGCADGKLLMWALDVSSFFERNKEDALLAHYTFFWVEFFLGGNWVLQSPDT